MKLILTCKQASQIVSQSLDRPLSWSDRMKLKFHFFICAACNRFNRQLHQLRLAVNRVTQLTENDSNIKLSVDAKIRITTAVESKTY
jgi:hypothetical protein